MQHLDAPALRCFVDHRIWRLEGHAGYKFCRTLWLTTSNKDSSSWQREEKSGQHRRGSTSELWRWLEYDWWGEGTDQRLPLRNALAGSHSGELEQKILPVDLGVHAEVLQLCVGLHAQQLLSRPPSILKHAGIPA